jgi:CRISPR-associated protein Cas1
MADTPEASFLKCISWTPRRWLIKMKTRTAKIFLDDCGSFLGRGEGCLIVRDRHGKVEKYPLFENEIGEVHVRIGNSVSSAALATCAFWGIDLLILTQRGNPVAFLKSLDDESHVKTRIAQYEALKNGKGVSIAKQIVLGKIEGQNCILRKHGFRQHDLVQIKDRVAGIESNDLRVIRNRLITIEGHATERYFSQVFQLLPTAIGIEKRRTFKAFDGINNTLNLAYTFLKWKVHRAIIRAKLEPFLGFLHSEQFGKPSLVCDLMELYRYLIDDFVIQYCMGLRKKDFALKREDYSSNRKGERQYLSKPLAKDMMSKLNSFFESTVEVPRIRHGNKQTVETLINEEALMLAKHLRNESHSWVPRVPGQRSQFDILGPQER